MGNGEGFATKGLWGQVADWFIARHCYSCGNRLSDEDGNCVCLSCLQRCSSEAAITKNYCQLCAALTYDSSISVCYDCATEPRPFRKNTSFFRYQDPVIRHLLHRFKFLADKSVLSDISILLKPELANFFSVNRFDIIAPTPLSRSGLKKRGFNQVESVLKAEKISYTELFLRHEHKKRQSELSAEERRIAVRGQFEIKAEYAPNLSGKSLLIVDDICTTGSTLSELCRLAIECGAKSVDALSFFRD